MSWDWLSRLEALRRSGEPVVLVTVARVEGSAPRETGAKMLVLRDRFHGTVGGGHLEELALEEARKALTDGAARVVRYPLGAAAGQCCGGIVELLFEPVAAGPELYVFGAGHVGRALCRTLAETPFRVHLVDERPEWLNAPEIPAEVTRHDDDWESVVGAARWDAERTYAVIMTHRHDLDESIVAALLRRPRRYLGLIGSRAKWGRFRARLEARGFRPEELDGVRCPVGLDIGGKAPPEVAISIAAELLGIHYERTSAAALSADPAVRGPILADGSA